MNTEITLPQTHFKHTIVTDIELNNGKKSQIITIFNSSELNFEEMVIGINTAINRQVKFYKNIKSAQHTFCGIRKDGLNKVAMYDKTNF